MQQQQKVQVLEQQRVQQQNVQVLEQQKVQQQQDLVQLLSLSLQLHGGLVHGGALAIVALSLCQSAAVSLLSRRGICPLAWVVVATGFPVPVPRPAPDPVQAPLPVALQVAPHLSHPRTMTQQPGGVLPGGDGVLTMETGPVR